MRHKLVNLVGDCAIFVLWICTYERTYRLGMHWLLNFWCAVIPAFVVSLLILRLAVWRLGKLNPLP